MVLLRQIKVILRQKTTEQNESLIFNQSNIEIQLQKMEQRSNPIHINKRQTSSNYLSKMLKFLICDQMAHQILANISILMDEKQSKKRKLANFEIFDLPFGRKSKIVI